MNELIKIIKMHSVNYYQIGNNLYIYLDIMNAKNEWTTKKVKIKNKKQLLNLLGY